MWQTRCALRCYPWLERMIAPRRQKDAPERARGFSVFHLMEADLFEYGQTSYRLDCNERQT